MLMQFLKTQFVLKFYYLQITCTTFSEELILLFYSEYTDKNTHSVERYCTLKWKNTQIWLVKRIPEGGLLQTNLLCLFLLVISIHI